MRSYSDRRYSDDGTYIGTFYQSSRWMTLALHPSEACTGEVLGHYEEKEGKFHGLFSKTIEYPRQYKKAVFKTKEEAEEWLLYLAWRYRTGLAVSAND